ncbi:hypothetical protein [Pseudothauera rhizosphaerae]|uniref:Uncharacterized protein n=1 Tax=Pseudothauera rhizosphaerae TaxID=2565932 RepID=A0A4S4AMY4_9RHOO|nr:hypothetical protein [Pseudothauera rhizosphaerae]THF60898.1 hypothetical protein E6O51_11750 [Pseudothauera rhizosphaerae]
MNKGTPGSHPLARVGALGLPYHGLVLDGWLTLPDGSMLQIPTGPRTDVTLVRRSGWIAPPRTPAQLAGDAARGWEWRDYALLNSASAGTSETMIGGRSMEGGWLWFDADGQPWRVRVVATEGVPDVCVFSLEFRRFGRFGAPGGIETRDTVPIDLQQGVPVQVVTAAGNTQNVAAGAGIAEFDLVDVVADGSRALLAAPLVYWVADSPTSWAQIRAERRAVAWVELSISGNKSVSATLLKGRADCLGTRTPPEYTGSAGVDMTHLHVEVVAGPGQYDDVAYLSVGDVTTEREEAYHWVTAPLGGFSGLPYPSADREGVGSVRPYSVHAAARVPVGAWYDAGGEVVWAEVDVSWDAAVSGSHDVSIVNAVSEQLPPEEGFDDPLSASFESVSQVTTAARYSLLVDGDVLSVTEVTIEHSASFIGEYRRPWWEVGQPSMVRGTGGHKSTVVSIDGVVVHEADETGPGAGFNDDDWHLTSSLFFCGKLPDKLLTQPHARNSSGTWIAAAWEMGISTGLRILDVLMLPQGDLSAAARRARIVPLNRTALQLYRFGETYARPVARGNEVGAATRAIEGSLQPVTGEWYQRGVGDPRGVWV